jgi:hypothetical protein
LTAFWRGFLFLIITKIVNHSLPSAFCGGGLTAGRAVSLKRG